MTRPLVRYFGGKWILGPWIVSFFPKHRVYVEPFGGGGSVLMQKERSHTEVYNDLDQEIVNLFRVTRDRGAELAQAVELTPYSREEWELSTQPAEDELEQARRTMVRCWFGHGSNGFSHPTGFRSQTRKNGSSAAMDWRRYPAGLADLVDRLRGVVIEQGDALEVMTRHDAPDTLHYVDPPYVMETRGGRQRYRHELSVAEHETLLNFLEGLEGAVLVSGYSSELYEDKLAGWHREEKSARTGAPGENRTEVLWMRGCHVQPSLL